MDNQDILIDIILPEITEHPDLFNDVSRTLYKIYEKPMGANLSLIISYVILDLEKQGKLNRKEGDANWSTS